MTNVFADTVLLIDKAKGVTSFDTVSEAKRLTGQKKIGHCGTLDMFASGLLILCTGKATRLVRHLMAEDKRYEALVQLGTQTDTDDASGNVIKTGSFGQIKAEDIESALEGFKGEQLQQPPLYSALKIKGSRSSDLVRLGKTVELALRPVYIKNISLVNYWADAGLLQMEVTCSKGTYIRALSRDLGNRLGCRAHCSELRRLASGGFSVEDAVPVEELSRPEAESRSFCLSPAKALAGYGSLALNTSGTRKALNGAPFSQGEVKSLRMSKNSYNKDVFIILSEDENLIAIANIDVDKWQIRYLNVFNNSQTI